MAKYFIDCSNLSCRPDKIMRTGIQEVVHQILVQTIALREDFPQWEILALPALPHWKFPWRHRLVVPHFNLPPPLCEQLEDELRLPSKTVWGMDLRARGFQLSDSEIRHEISSADRCLLPSIIDFTPFSHLNKTFSAILHDFVAYKVPEYTSEEMAAWMPKAYYPSLFTYAQKIFANSKSTALEVFDYDFKKTHAQLFALPLAFPKPSPPGISSPKVLENLGLVEKNFLIILGSLEPRKYILGAIEGFDRYCELFPEGNLKLLQIGGTGWKNDEVLDRIKRSPYRANIIRAGYIADQDLSTLLKASAGLVMLSQYEGFGIPVAMALSHRVPVITTYCSSFPEACAGQAIFVDSYNSESVALGIHRALEGRENPSLSKQVTELLENWTWLDYVRALHREVLK